MLLQQVLEELSSSCRIDTPNSNEDEKSRGRGSLSHHKKQHISNIPSALYANGQKQICGNHKDRLGAPMAASSVVPPSGAKRSGPLTRHTSATNAQYLHKAAVAAREIQVSGHGRLSAPALLANCLLSMISLSDDEDDQATSKIEHNSPSTKNEGRSTILKSFSQLRAEERNGKDVHHHSLHTADHHKKLQFITCCLFPCSRESIYSKNVGSTLELFNNSDDLSSSNDDCNSGSRAHINGDAAGALRSLLKRVLCKGSVEVGTGSSIGDHELVFDERWAGGAPILTQSHVNQGYTDTHIDNHISSMYEYAYMYDNGYGDLYGSVKCKSEKDGGVAQEVVHEVMSLSHDAPVASSFVFEQSCFSPSSSTSSTTHCMKLESAHPWLNSRADIDSCTSSPRINPPTNRVVHGVMQDDLQFRLANKRLNLSR